MTRTNKKRIPLLGTATLLASLLVTLQGCAETPQGNRDGEQNDLEYRTGSGILRRDAPGQAKNVDPEAFKRAMDRVGPSATKSGS